MVVNVASRAAAMFVMILTVHFTVPYLGAERFGVWMTIASFTALLTFLDLGIGNALTNKIAHAVASDDADEIRNVISGGLAFLFVVACLVGVLLVSVVNHLPWESLVKVAKPETRTELRRAVQMFSLLFAANLFCTGVQRVYAGLQRSYEAHLYAIAGSVLSALAIWLATRIESDIPILLVASIGGALAANLGLLVLLYFRRLLTVVNLASNCKRESHDLLRVGGLYFVLQIGTMIAGGADSLIISSVQGASEVTAFSLTQRLFQMLQQPMYVMNTPLWGAYADAHARGDHTFVRRTFAFSMKATVVFAITAALFLYTFGETIVAHWTQHHIAVSVSLLASFAIWSILDACGNAFAMLLNGVGIIRPQITSVVLFAGISIVVKLVLLNNFGIPAMILGTAVVYGVVTSVVYGVWYRDDVHLKLNGSN
jgi:O-antigen/teichoic acid export membrane protein